MVACFWVVKVARFSQVVDCSPSNNASSWNSGAIETCKSYLHWVYKVQQVSSNFEVLKGVGCGVIDGFLLGGGQGSKTSSAGALQISGAIEPFENCWHWIQVRESQAIFKSSICWMWTNWWLLPWGRSKFQDVLRWRITLLQTCIMTPRQKYLVNHAILL